MEKVKIRKCEEIMDGKAQAVELADGRKATAWCDKVDCKALFTAYSAMSEIEVELKPYKSKAGKEGLNIVAINYAGTTKEIRAVTFETTPSELVTYDAKQGNASANGQYQKPIAKEKDEVCINCGGSGCDNCNARYVPQMPKPEDYGEADITSINAKSSVKLTKNSKGIGWEIKVVTGEIDLIQGLGIEARAEHKRLCEEFPVEE